MQENNYLCSNYDLHENSGLSLEIGNVAVKKGILQNNDLFHISVGSERKRKLRIAIANTKLSHKNFEKLMKDKPDRSYLRYKDISSVVNQAIEGKVDMLVMPEAFVPFEWLNTLARTCARNNLAIITGIEHVKINDNVLNLTAAMNLHQYTIVQYFRHMQIF